MTETRVIAVDMDGVLAKWNEAFLDLLNEMHKTDKAFPTSGPTSWGWPRQLGFTNEQEAAAWAHVRKDGWWWHDLAPYADTEETLDVLRGMRDSGWAVYFVTARFPLGEAKHATTAWLDNEDYPHAAVITVPHGVKKAQIFDAVGVHVVIEDRPDNCIPKHKNLLVDRPWNQRPEDWPTAPWDHLQRVHDLPKALRSVRDLWT